MFIYLLEGQDERAERIKQILQYSRDREDSLFTSHLAIGEVMAGARNFGGEAYLCSIREVLAEMGFSYLSFDAGAVDTFSHLRGRHHVKVADAIHLGCAASAKMDLFLTGDVKLTKLYVPGIHFIVNFDTSFI